MPSRGAHWTEMMQIVQRWTRQRTVAEVLATLESAGVPCAHYAEPADTLADAQAQSRGLFAPVQDAAGAFTGINAPWKMSGGGVAMGGRVPGLGEHNAEVLREWLGVGS